MAVGRSLGAVTPSHWPIRIVTEIPLAVMGSVLKRVPALDGVVYRPIKIKVDRERHEPDLSALGIPDYNDKSRVVGAEWVATRERFAAGLRTDVVLFLHGGAFCLYSPRSYRPVTRQLAKLGFTVLAANYRKSPKHPFPSGLHDAIAAYLWLVRDEGVDPARILLLGDSAGGALALGLFQAISALDLLRPAAVALWSPCLSMDPRLLDSVVTNADKDFLSVLTNHKLGIIRMYAGDHVVRAGKPAMDEFLANPFVKQTSAQPSCPVLIQSSPSEQLATCISDFYASQDPATARVQHDLLVDTPHDPFFIGVLIPLTANQDLVQVGFQRLWKWWRDVQGGAVPFGKVQRMWYADGRVEVVDDTTARTVQIFEA
ncbi:hypothetical protein AMAG_06398 [Allomyces macrogynus ATCC 38327]|uniref:Alpha/beta hydrolase fold-3 domain-containing protein n=1 Tax=Allomyces macrogynus (strain ATCC 38327) TaxID=578462 RepID=A0A0L0SGE4_ALLM3|nr:hypothetical protein AMAG_06398 [Allomyces macrogynus ATCC 38327]|eukprot:KNE61586.1 hypothetical protein AMAG_06398 [Allomyces macrogynus ATCC 38327]